MFSLQKLWGGEEKVFSLLEASAEEARKSVRALVNLSKGLDQPVPLDEFVRLRLVPAKKHILPRWHDESRNDHGGKSLPVGRLVAIERRAIRQNGRADEIQIRHMRPIRDHAGLRVRESISADSIPESERVGVGAVAVAPLFTGVDDHKIARAVAVSLVRQKP